jgi:hypothetical protein
VKQALLIFSLFLTACSTPIESTKILDSIANEICDCTEHGDTSNGMNNLYFNCYDEIVRKHRDELNSIHMDRETLEDAMKLDSEIGVKRLNISCRENYQLAMKEMEEYKAREQKLEQTFQGFIVSDTILPNYQYLTKVKSISNNEIKEFLSNSKFKDIDFLHGNIKNDTLNIVYKVLHDSITNQDMNQIMSINGASDVNVIIQKKE